MFDEWKEAKECMHLLNTNNKAEANARIIAAIERIVENGTQYGYMWASIMEAAGFYPYLSKYREIFQNNDTSSMITQEFFASDNMSGIYFHEEQKEIVKKLEAERNMIISAPTSFGKSLLIEEIVASQKYKNIIIIQPTLALLDETRKKLSRYVNYYKLIVHTSQEPDSNRGNIFLFTAERVLEYQKFPTIEFFVLDEFYKLSKKRDDERADILNNAFHNIIKKYNCKFMLLGPNIDDISKGFAHKYDAEFFKTNYSLVLNEEINVYEQYQGQFGERGEKKIYKQKVLFELLSELNGQPTLIFCSSPDRVRKLSKAYVEFLKSENKKQREEQVPLIEWIDKNVTPNWSLAELLRYSVGIHDGSLPKHITSSIINYFAEGMVNCLFCTTTIIEGVNTCAQNIIYFDKTKGKRVPIDYFDYCNIRGRAGRMMVHFTGKIYNFNEPPRPELTIVDIPFFDQENISDEILINLERDEMKYPEREQNQYILNLPENIKKIFKQNGVSVRGQEEILRQLAREENYKNIYWSGKPSYEQLGFVLELAWNNLLRDGETTSPMTLSKLIKLTFDYGNGTSVKDMIASDFRYKTKGKKLGLEEKKEVLDESIQSIFQIIRHWFQYKIPKWIGVVNSLQEYVCSTNGKKAGSYAYYASLIEHDAIPEHIALLLEYNIPASTIKKILSVLPADLKDQELVDYIFINKVCENEELLEYERQLISRNLITSKEF